MRRDSLWNRMTRSAPTAVVSSAGLPAITVRDVMQADRDALQRLAQLDSSTLCTGRALVAEVDGEPWAVLSLDDGRALANPFRPSVDVVGLLHERARQLRGEKRPTQRWLRKTRSARYRSRRVRSTDRVRRRLAQPT